jgi:hypothetical protein
MFAPGTGARRAGRYASIGGHSPLFRDVIGMDIVVLPSYAATLRRLTPRMLKNVP